MKAKTVVPLVVGLGVGFFAIKMAVDMASRAKGSSGESRKVVVAGNTIPSATRITEQMLTVAEVPAKLVPHGAMTDAKSLVGRVTKLTVPGGVPIGQTMLAPPGSEPGLRSLIPEGYRAMSVKVNEASAVAGFLQPGTHVDVFAGEGGRRGVSSKSRLILSDIEVGAVGQSLNEVGTDGKTVKVSKSVTLFVKPEQVPALHAAASREQIQLTMRGDGDKGASESMWQKLFGERNGEEDEDDAPKKVEKPAAPVQVAVATKPIKKHRVELLQGQKLERVYFDEQGRLIPEDKDNKNNQDNQNESGQLDVAASTVVAPVVTDPK